MPGHLCFSRPLTALIAMIVLCCSDTDAASSTKTPRPGRGEQPLAIPRQPHALAADAQSAAERQQQQEQIIHIRAEKDVVAERLRRAVKKKEARQEKIQDRMVRIRRLVYRVTFIVPSALRDRRTSLRPGAGELVVDVSDEQLKARFTGPGWPLQQGAVAVVYRDAPGASIVDGSVRRQLGPGEMASWFQGRTIGRAHSTLRVRREYGHSRTTSGPGELICTLLAEWTDQPRDLVARRCAGNVLPPGFRFGPWNAELTAVVPMQIQQRKLLAEDEQPAEQPPAASGTLVDPAELGNIRPSSRSRDKGPQQPDALLHFVNHTNTRVIVVVEGVPIGWVNAESSGVFTGFVPGRYQIGAVRPLGGLLLGPRMVSLPNKVILGRPPLDRPPQTARF